MRSRRRVFAKWRGWVEIHYKYGGLAIWNDLCSCPWPCTQNPKQYTCRTFLIYTLSLENDLFVLFNRWKRTPQSRRFHFCFAVVGLGFKPHTGENLPWKFSLFSSDILVKSHISPRSLPSLFLSSCSSTSSSFDASKRRILTSFGVKYIINRKRCRSPRRRHIANVYKKKSTAIRMSLKWQLIPPLDWIKNNFVLFTMLILSTLYKVQV